MHFHVITLFPETIEQWMGSSIMGRARDKGCFTCDTIQLRDYSDDKWGSVDDYTYGGGAGMLIRAEPVYRAWKAAMERTGPSEKPPVTICASPRGVTFDQAAAAALSEEEELVFICGHYEGIDERVLEEVDARRYSIGDYVISGGELAVLVMMDAIARMVPGVLHNELSGVSESFMGGLLEYPQYTRPASWRGRDVPEILLSGDHRKVDQWRLREARRATRLYREDLYELYLAERGIY